MSIGGLRRKGSDNEDEYFQQQDRKIIEEQRRNLDAQRAQQEKHRFTPALHRPAAMADTRSATLSV